MRATAACGITRPEWLRLSRQPRNHLIAMKRSLRCVEGALKSLSCGAVLASLPAAFVGGGLFLVRVFHGTDGPVFLR
jgi:hypothetical protein